MTKPEGKYQLVLDNIYAEFLDNSHVMDIQEIDEHRQYDFYSLRGIRNELLMLLYLYTINKYP